MKIQRKQAAEGASSDSVLGSQDFPFLFFYLTVKYYKFYHINPDLQWYKKTKNKPKQIHICFCWNTGRSLVSQLEGMPKGFLQIYMFAVYMSMTGFMCALPTLQ